MMTLFLIHILLQETRPPTQWALLVGVDRYLNLPSLGGAVNDVANMKDLLMKNLEFQENHITTLLNEQATRASILSALQNLANVVGKNDRVIFHFSGHGSQVRDLSGDEPDGLDETLVPYDSRAPGIFDISDDQIHLVLSRLTQRCKNVTFIFDSCHSGSGQRVGASRWISADKRMPVESSEPSTSVGFGRLEAENYVMISACQTNQTAGELEVARQKQGILTHYLTKALRRADQHTTWNFIMEQVRQEVEVINKNQTPQLHGNGNRVIFGVEEWRQTAHIIVNPINGSRLNLNAGLIHGLTQGSIFNIFKAGSVSIDQKVGQARIIRVDPLTSEAELLSGGPVEKGSWAIEWEHGYSGQPLAVHLGKGVESLVEGFQSDHLIQKVLPTEAILIMELNQNGELLFKDREGSLLGVPHPLDRPDLVKKALQKWIRWFNLLSIGSLGSHTPNTRFTIERENMPASTDPVFFAGEDLVMRVENNSRRNLYICILQLNTTGEISQILPGPGEVVQPIPPGGSWVETFTAELSEGLAIEKSILKLFATYKPVDFSFLFQEGARGSSGRPIQWTVLQKTTVIKK